MSLILRIFVLSITLLSSCKNASPTPASFLEVKSVLIDGLNPSTNDLQNISTNPKITINFSSKLKSSSLNNSVILTNFATRDTIKTNFQLTKNDSTAIFSPQNPLKNLSKYSLELNQTVKSSKNEQLQSGIQVNFSTLMDSTDKLPRISDEALLTLVQKQTFKYFWDFGHPVSGLARERDTSGDIITSGGSGFGIMAIPVAIERSFISRTEGLDRMLKITDFLINKAEKFHGVFPHWLNGATGATVPFSSKDNGADLVETSYLMMGLLATRQYFDQNSDKENLLRKQITQLWEAVEWDWHTQNDQKVLYWHWSPNYGWQMNHQIHGWNEALITYILAAASPTHAISKDVYDQGWARSGAQKNGGTFYGHKLPLGENLGGPLFFEQYTFLGIDPRNLSDAYANYAEQTRNHSLINRAYCIDNPKKYLGYSKDCWGLTASDTYNGYSAHSPTNDLGVITPTAALSSMPFTPAESMDALRFFYFKLGDKLWKNHGFIDAFSLDRGWYATSFLAIDQGPIIGMIENHRTGLLWKLTMKDPDVQSGLKKLGFKF
ncbi:MAG: glucoamylase family protein [Spirosomataceae bacterium]|jgi:hypothetical protein